MFKISKLAFKIVSHLHLIFSQFSYIIFFKGNPLMEAGGQMFNQLESACWEHCTNCKETYICINLMSRSQKCQRCSKNPSLFHVDNDLNPSPTPDCLAVLSPVEKSAISLICPTIAIYVQEGSFFNI